METLEKSRMCRLCGKQSGIAVDIFDKNESHVRKINAILPILVHEMDLLPKQMCHRCSYKLEEFYNFYVVCAQTDTELKNQLSWMRKENLEEEIVKPMVKMIPFKIKAEPPDALNSDNALGQTDHNSLLFPESVLQNSSDSTVRPIISCSRCQCLCSRNIKINKTSPKSSSASLENQSHSSMDSNESFVNNEFNRTRNVNNYFEKDCAEDNFKDMKIKEIINLESNDFSNSDTCTDDSIQIKNRSLRPRKSSIDYMGTKKKGVANNLKIKLNNKLDILDPTLVNPVEIKVCQGNSFHPSPIIKLEKVDDTVKSLRVQKNLEEFNRRIKALKFSRIKHKKENLRMKVLNKMKNLSAKEHKDEKCLRKEENEKLILQAEDVISLRRKNSHKEDSHNKTNLWITEDINKKTVQADNDSVSTNLKGENILTRKCSVKMPENKNHSSKGKDSRSESSTNNIENNDNNENLTFNLSDVVIKQEVVNKLTKHNETVSDEEQTDVTTASRDKYSFKSVERLPLCAVVKLEKDYTCNVDYPRIKIKRHLAVANSSKSKDNALEPLRKQSRTIEKVESNNSLVKNDLNKKKRVKHIKKNKSGIVSKKVKQFNVVKNKLTGSHKTHTDLKCYCEECDTCFKTKELFRLHPCYQN